MNQEQFKRVYFGYAQTIKECSQEMKSLKEKLIENHKPFEVGEKVEVKRKNAYKPKREIGYVKGFEVCCKLRHGSVVDIETVINTDSITEILIIPIVLKAKLDGNPSKQRSRLYFSQENDTVVKYQEDES